MLIIYLNPKSAQPGLDEGPCVLHYLHAKNIVLGENTIAELIKIMH